MSAARDHAALVPVSEAKRLVALAIADGDAATLHELRARASAYELYHARNGALETANEAGEIKVRAERGLARLDVEAAPNGVTFPGGRKAETPLESLDKNARAAIRKLATLDDLEFERRIQAARDDENAGVSTTRVLKAATDSFTGTAHSSKTDEWATPQDLFDELDREFGFELDVCASNDNAKCGVFYTRAENGLAQPWTGVCWMNPPYGGEIAAWVRKAYESAQDGATVVCLVPARVDTGWWWDYCRFGEVRFLRGRLRFGGGENGAPFPSAVVVFGRPADVIWWERS